MSGGDELATDLRGFTRMTEFFAPPDFLRAHLAKLRFRRKKLGPYEGAITNHDFCAETASNPGSAAIACRKQSARAKPEALEP